MSQSRHSLRAATTARRLFFIIALLIIASVFVVGAAAKLTSAFFQDGDISVTKTGPDMAAPDTNITYTITVTTTGPDDNASPQLVDHLAAGTTFVSIDTSGAAPGWLCTDPGVGNNGPVTCNNATTTADSTDVFTITVHIPADTPPGTFFTNIANVSGDPDNNDENDEGVTVTQTPGDSTDLSLNKTGPTQVHPDTDVPYTITVTNPGPNTATNVSFTDHLPSGVPGGSPMTFVSFNQTNGPSWDCGSPAATTTCSIASLPPGTSTFSFVGHVAPGVADAVLFTNETNVTSQSDPNSENDHSATVATVVSGCFIDQVVTTNAESGAGSLRQAIIDACPGSTITFDMTQVVSPITLSTGELIVNKNLTITGPGANLLTVDANQTSRVFNIGASVTAVISGLTVANGKVISSAPGGGIYIDASGTLTLTDSTLSGNSASGGSTSSGGGIANLGTLTITNSTLSGNSASGGSFGNSGGGISNNTGATLTIVNSTLSGNSASGGPGGSGGAISNSGIASVTNSTLSGNSASSGAGGSGGGILNTGTLTITNSTLSGNSASSSGGASFGGGITTGGGSGTTLTITSSTLSGNSLSGGSDQGGGIFCSGTVNIRNTIIAGNSVEIGQDASSSSAPDVSGALTSMGHNIIGDTSGAIVTATTGDKFDSAASPVNLGPLQNNGGPTKTMALLAGSTALDAGDNCVTDVAHCGDANIPQLTTDQRGAGFSRSVDGPDADTTATVDIGAFEAQVSVEDITEKATNEDTQLQFTFNIGGNVSTITATSSNTAVAPDPSLSGSGSTRTLTINPVANQFGTSTITVTVLDSGGQSMTDTFTLTVNSANDAPSFTEGANQTINEDGGAQIVPNWATNISAGPEDESGQTLSFNVTNNTNASLFSAGPVISSTGTLSYTPAANANGTATITIVLMDNGGTANGGQDTSAPQSFDITVTPVNDAPSFTKGADQTVSEDAGAQAVPNWATALSAGPPNESGQTLTFQVTNNTNAGLFSAAPAVSSTGTLTYTPAPNANGTATITIALMDNGGTANGGHDTSAPQSFTITVTPVNDAPSFTNGPDQTVNEDASAQTVPNWPTAISVGPPDESGQTLQFTVTNNTNAALFSAGPAISPSGTLTYTPAPNASGVATITIVLKDNGGTANGGQDTSAPQSFAITINPIADTPSVTNASTTVNAQTTSGLVISRSPADGAEVTHFKITNITGGTLFRNDGTSQINNGDFIAFAEGNAGLKFTPALNSTANGSFQVQASLNSTDAGLGGGLATATISVTCGATVVVNSNDSGAGSLRDTILHACDGATITFDLTPGKVTNPIALTSGELSIDRSLTIQGPSANLLTVQRSAEAGTPLFSIFSITKAALNVSGLTLSNADSAVNGGAIKNFGGTLTIDSVVLSGNHTSAGGSAIYNTASFDAIFGTVTLTNSTVSGNRSDGVGAIFNSNGTINITNSTLTGNTNQGSGPGSAIFNSSTTFTNVTNCTISQNTGGSAVFQNSGSPGKTNLKNTIVSGNSGGDVSGTTDLGNNVIGGNARLAALGNYGGPTQTMALLPGSPAINTGTATGAPTTDQRGISRVGAVDIGAFESRGFTISAASGTPQSATILSAFGSPLVASIGGVGGEPVNGGIITFAAPATGASAVLTGGGATATASIAGGQASINATANGVGGSYNVSASAVGASPASFSLTNNKAATTTTVTSSLNPSDLNQNVTFTAKVTGAVTPTGSVQFKDNGTSLGSPVALNGSGMAQLTTSALTAGNHTITADYSGDGNLLPSTGTLASGQTVGFRPLIKFSQATYSVNENGGVISITVVRQGDTSPAVTVDYATPDDSAAMSVLPCSNANGVASPRCDFTTALGTLRFAAGETSKTFNVLISQDLWVEGDETAQLTLSNPTGGAAFQQPGDALAVLTIVDDDTSPPTTNAIDDSTNFVRQQYHDFLNREPDTTGLNFWVNQIESCGADTQCRAVKRINVSAAFFLSIEFQNTGYFVERMYKAGFGDIAPPTVPVPVRFTNFLTDSQEIRGNIIVGQGNWQQQIEDAKRAFALAFVKRPAFLNRYPAITSAEAFVDSLNTNAGMVLLDSERSALIAELSPNPADAALRADVLQKVAENAVLQQQEFNRAFVLMQYFGYLRRNPDAAPEATLNFAGYNFWLGKLNAANGDYVGAELIKAFITSGEYRGRFGP